MKARWPLERKFMFLVCILVTMIMLMVVIVYIYFERKQTRELLGEQALTTAIAVSEMPFVKEVILQNENATMIQPLIERIRKQSGAEFIVISDADEVRYTHPDKEKIGQKMIGGDNERALIEGENYISFAKGSLGMSVRGKSPIYDENNQIIGVVSVGFMLSYVDSLFEQGLAAFSIWLAFIFISGVAGSFMLAKSIRKDTFGLEPYQIARLYKERGAILEALNEGLIATDQKGNVTLINHSGKKILGIRENIIGQPVQKVLRDSEISHVLANQLATGHYETIYDKKPLIVHYKIIGEKDSYAGKLASFQEKSGVQELVNTLSEVQQYSQDLRAQTHEYTNKLYAISGWLQLGYSEKAKQFIHEEIGQQKIYERVLFERITDSTIQAVLIGKLSKASEKKIDFIIDEDSFIQMTWPIKMTATLVTILGNIIDNAFDAVAEEAEPLVDLFLTDIGDELVIELGDNGCGIEKADINMIFNEGYTTKAGRHRGFGLALVKAALGELNGTIHLSKNQPYGTVIHIHIPKTGAT